MQESEEYIEITRIINRHKARFLSNLNEIACPKIIKDAVISAYDWMRSDVQNALRKFYGE